MLHSFIRAGRLKLWLERNHSPALRLCKNLLEKLVPNVFDGQVEPLAEEIQVGPNQQMTICARFHHDGVTFARWSSHLGNSLIQFYSSGNKRLSPVAGQIEQIYTRGEDIILSVKRHLPANDGIKDPFRFYPHLPIKLYSAELADGMENVEVG